MKDGVHDGLDGVCLLILEDEAIILMDLVQLFEEQGAEVRPALTVDSALDKLDEAAPDCAVLDVNLGGGTTCREVAERLRELNIPFLLHSGDLDRNGELISALAAPIVAKPASSLRLIEGVRRAIGTAA